MTKDLLCMSKINKHFPGVHALKDVDFSLRRGEVHALLGENGAGKSTLIKVLGGIYSSDSGTIVMEGREVTIRSVADAYDNGLAIIHQELCLAANMSVAQNIFMGREKLKNLGLGLVDFDEINRCAVQIMKEIGLDISPSTLVEELSIAQRQMVEICKAISFNAKIIVMDEPTSSLCDKEVDMLFALIKRLQKKNVSIIYISHKLEELWRIADRVTVLRDGENITTQPMSDVSRDLLVKAMVGRDIKDLYIARKMFGGEPILTVKNLTTKYIKDVSFELQKGEILGISGLIGAGRTELARALFGLDPILSGEIWLNGQNIDIHSPKDAIKRGISLIPEDRKKTGLILVNSVGFNITLLRLSDFINNMRYNRVEEHNIFQQFVEALSIRTTGYEQQILNLSGGNQQKVVISKWLSTNPKILIMDEPTRGIDIGSKKEIYSLMEQMLIRDISIIMISSELPEIIGMCSRVLVMRDGQVSSILDGAKEDIAQESVMACAMPD